MPNVTITQLPPAGPITGTESVPIVQNGQTVQTTTAALAGSPVQTQTFLTVTNEPTLNNSRYLSTGTGLGLSDGGAQSFLRIALNGASASLEGAGNGLVVKTAINAVTARSIAVSGAGLTITNGSGVSGNPTLALNGLVASLAGVSGTGLLAVTGVGTMTPRSILGTSGQIAVTNGDGIFGSPQVGLTNTTVTPGSYTLANITVDAQGRITAATSGTAGAGTVTQINTGTGLSGGPITTSGTISIDTGVVVTLSDTQTLTNKSISGATNTLSGIPNAALNNSSVTINGSTVSLGGSTTITAAVSYPLTISTGLSGSSYDGQTPVTIAIDSTVVTLSGTQTLTNKTINGANNTVTGLPNSALNNSSVTINGSSVSLGGSTTVTATATNALTIGTGLSGTSYNGSSPVTIAIDSSVVTLSGSQTLTNKTLTSSTINSPSVSGGSIDNATIGSSTPAAGTFTSVAMTTGTISTTPANSTDIVNKAYVDGISAGINFHQACRLGTATALPACTYNNGSSGVGATLTANANGALSVDGTAVASTNRILVKNQANQAQNGVYVVTQTGSPSTPFILTRASDYNTAGSGVNQIDAGDFFLITAGATLSNTSWVQQTPLPITVGTTAIVFQQFGATNVYTAGTGLTESPTYTFNIANTGVSAATYGTASSVPTIAVNAQGQITSASNTSIAIAGSQITSGQVAIANGGTGQATASAAFDAIAPTTTQGDLIVRGASSNGRLAIGAANYALTSNGTTASWAQVNLTAGVTGTLPIANGGTNATSTPSAGAVAYGTGTAYAFTSAGTSSQVLLSGGSGSPTWANQSSLSVGSATTATTASNVSGGTTGSLLYQSTASTTTSLSLGTTNYVLTAGASAPQYVAQSTLSVGSATNATNATNVGITANSANATNYLTFVSATSGNLPQLVNSSITCNPSTGAITGGISGGTF